MSLVEEPQSPRVSQPIDEHIGRLLRLRRRQMALTLAQLGVLVGVTFQQIAKYESGQSRVSAETLWRLAKVLEVQVGFFYEGLG